tara:strand:+ start:1835 stop:2077 length:243 start_codon:yes stop_codon:yes gene_type:complete
MKIGVLGGDFKLIQFVIASLGHQAVLVCEDDIIEQDKRLTVCGDPLENFPVEYKSKKINADNSFRAGSIGKGGKIKYRRT